MAFALLAMLGLGPLGQAFGLWPALPLYLVGAAGALVLLALALREARGLSSALEVVRSQPLVVGQNRPFRIDLDVQWTAPQRCALALFAEWPDELIPIARRDDAEAVDVEWDAVADDEPEVGSKWRPLTPLERAAGEACAVEPADANADGVWSQRFALHARATKRGMCQMGRVRVWLDGRWMRRRIDVEGQQRMRVEPPMVQLARTLELVATNLVWDQGIARVRRARGGQNEFESLRDYVPGDEPRRLDWKAYARRGKPMVRQYEPERGQEVILLLDRGRRMGVAVETDPPMTKFDRALDAALMFTAAVLTQRDRVGLLCFDDDLVKWVAPGLSSRQFQRIKEATFALAPSQRESRLASALEQLSTLHRRRALVLILTDLPDPAAWEAEARALRLATKHRVVYVALNDPPLVAAAAHAPDDLERHAAQWLLEERARGLATLKGHATPLDLPAVDGLGALLRAWFQERRKL